MRHHQKNVRHHTPSTTRANRTAATALLLGVGSLIDLRGLDTYRALLKASPPRRPKAIDQVTADATRLMSIRTLKP